MDRKEEALSFGMASNPCEFYGCSLLDDGLRERCGQVLLVPLHHLPDPQPHGLLWCVPRPSPPSFPPAYVRHPSMVCEPPVQFWLINTSEHTVVYASPHLSSPASPTCLPCSSSPHKELLSPICVQPSTAWPTVNVSGDFRIHMCMAGGGSSLTVTEHGMQASWECT